MLMFQVLGHVMANLPLFVLVLGLVLAGREFYHWTSGHDLNNELTTKNNTSFGIVLGGYLFGLGVALCGALFGIQMSASHSWRNYLDHGVTVVVLGILSIVLMRISIWVNDNFILNKFLINPQIFDHQNNSVAFVVAGSCIATGLVLNGALVGESDNLARGFLDTTIYWAFGQVCLVLGGRAFQWVTPYDDQQLIEKERNVPAGVLFGAFLVGQGLVVREALAGATGNIVIELLTASVMAAVGTAVLVGVTFGVDRVFLRGSTLKKEIEGDQNTGAAVTLAACILGAAFLLTQAMGLSGAANQKEQSAAAVATTDTESEK